MNDKTKIKRALNALKNHPKIYKKENIKISIPDRLQVFWKTGEALRYDGLCLPKETRLLGWDNDSTFELRLVSPRWDSMLLTLDDAVVGPIGDWKKAHNYLPLFVGGEQSEFCIVVKIDEPCCPVGLFEEATCLNCVCETVRLRQRVTKGAAKGDSKYGRKTRLINS